VNQFSRPSRSSRCGSFQRSRQRRKPCLCRRST
jgi:hypothetical protein